MTTSRNPLITALKAHTPDNFRSHSIAVNSILLRASEDIKELTGLEVKVSCSIGQSRMLSRNTGLLHISLSSIILAACEVFEVSPKMLISGNRKRNVVDCKRVVSSLCINRYRIETLNKVAMAMNISNHTSIIHHIKSCENLLKTDSVFEDKYCRTIDALEKAN